MDFLPLMDAPQFFRVAGVIGFVFYMASFAALQFEIIDGHGLTYSFLNVLAASLVLVSLMVDFNLASALTQISWITIGCAGLVMRAMRRRHRSDTSPASGWIPAG